LIFPRAYYLSFPSILPYSCTDFFSITYANIQNLSGRPRWYKFCFAEAIQTILRREAYPNPYEALKDLTRTNQKITADTMAVFIDGLQISAELKEELKQITPYNYTGVF
jgi:adenylosuccinate lyase